MNPETNALKTTQSAARGEEGIATGGTALAFLAGILFVSAAFAWLEYSDPYYFTQDDVYATELPGLLHGCRYLLRGRYPVWNPHQLAGSPGIWAGTNGQTYPPSCLSVLLAERVLRDPFASMEVFAFFHLIAGFTTCFLLARRAGARTSIASLCGICYSLSGAALIMGRSWHAVLGMLPWIPLILMMPLLLSSGRRGAGWVAATGLVIGIPFHIGFTQYWVYGLFFLFLTAFVIAFTGGIKAARLALMIPALLLGFALTLPVLMPQTEFSADILKRSGYGEGIGGGLVSMLLPYPLASARHPNFWGNSNLEYMGHMFYFGTTFPAAFAVGLFITAAGFKNSVARSRTVWFACGIIALLIALGRHGLIWNLFSLLPVFSLINNQPFRLLPFVIIFAVIGGGVAVDGILKSFPRRSRMIELLFAVSTVALMGLHVHNCRTAFYTYRPNPYPQISGEMENMLFARKGFPDGRVLPIGPQRSIQQDYPLSLMHQFPSVYGLFSLDGYDPLDEAKPLVLAMKDRVNADPVAASRAYGVRWIVGYIQNLTSGRDSSSLAMELYPKYPKETLFALIKTARHRLTISNLSFYELTDSAPLAFIEKGGSRTALPVLFDSSGSSVDLSDHSEGGTVVVNVLCWPQFKAFIDGREAGLDTDEWNRCVVAAPPRSRTLRCEFSPEWNGVFSSTILVLAAALLSFILISSRSGT